MLPLSSTDLKAVLGSSLTAPTPAHKRRRTPATQQAQVRRWLRAIRGLASGEYVIEDAGPLLAVRKVKDGAVYKVRLGPGLPVCTCPDWAKHGHGHICKHVVMAQLSVPAVAYVGIRTQEGAHVWVVRNRPVARITVKPLRHIVRHSPTGFEWGYGGSGPADLALSILADFLHDEEAAGEVTTAFKERVISRLPSTTWMLDETAITAFLHAVRAYA